MSLNARKDPIVAPGRVVTRFGEMEVSEDQILTFPVGIPGFEGCRHFVLLSSEELEPVQCLHGVDGPPASFLVVDPRRLVSDYRCELSALDRSRLGAGPDDPLLWLALLTAEPGAIYANLRAPIVINPARMLGFQVMPSDSVYPMRYPVQD
jgi:flagellar assembly factor FliW